MLNIEWNLQDGWSTPIIQPYGKISLEPSAMVFHYSFECFEGLKAYKDKNGRVRLFRPDMNMNRFKLSSKRLTLPVRRIYIFIIIFYYYYYYYYYLLLLLLLLLLL
jgi:branched-chain amino acid aminotransferase